MLKIAALVLLLLAVIALEAAGAEGSSGISMRVIDAGEILAKVEAGQPVEYDHIVVRGDLDLSKERLHRNITSPIRVNDSIFDGKINFNDAVLEMPVDLSGTNFTRDVYFEGTTFSGVAYFHAIKFSRDADFWGAIFIKFADLRGATFSGDVYFQGATFSESANFKDATFGGDACFSGAIFNGGDFGGAIFRGNAYFQGATFSGESFFWGADFGGDADFREVSFSRYAGFWEATFSGDIDFGWTTFSSEAYFTYATFKGNANFDQTEFNGNIEFENVIFENETSFYRAFFKRPAYFENSFIKSLNLAKAEYIRLHLRWDDIGSLHFDEAAYLALIKNYYNLGWYGDANRCYYDYRNAVRRSWQAASSPGFAAKVSSPLDRLVDFGEWLLYGYGVRPSFPIAWCIGIILAFGLIFWQKRCMRKIIVEERIEDSKDASDEVQVKTKARKAEINALDPLLFSLFTFTSGFTAFLHPTIEYKLERCMRWAIFERLLGPFFMALVITAISKTYLIR